VRLAPCNREELYRSQQYITGVYRTELAVRLKELGDEIERVKNGQPEINGYTQEDLDASSPGNQQIREHMEQQGLHGAAAAQIAAHQTREEKLPSLTREMMFRKYAHPPWTTQSASSLPERYVPTALKQLTRPWR
jgi:conjugative relaxase-like TrwC/TraI family protein